MAKALITMVAAAFLLTGAAGCGADRELDSLSLALEFEAYTMPDDTARLMIYILPSLVETSPGVEEAINCDLFVGPTADKTIYDYSSHFVKSVETVEFDPSSRSAVELKELPDMLLVFVIEALDQPGNLLAVGCGKGQIERGKKTFIPIYMELR